MAKRKGRCPDCDGYEKRGHNYCRMCGAELKRGVVKNVGIAAGYFTNEKFCGYCGKLRGVCNGAH
jgi:hypothetical protein